MKFLYSILGSFFGLLLSALYNWTHNYVAALVLLTLFARILMLPMSIKQQKSTAKMQRLQSKVRKIQQQYAGDQRKIQEETQALYSREGTSPMSMGCLPLLLQLPIIYGLIGAIYHPLQYVIKLPEASIAALKNALNLTEAKANIVELSIISRIGELTSLPKGITEPVMEKIRDLSANFNLFGMSLGDIPNWRQPSVLWTIPILAFLSQLASALVMYVRQKEQNPEMSKNPSMGCMTFGMPLLSLVFTFQFPIGIGIYWIVSSLIAFVQMLVLNKIYSPKKMTAKLLVEETVQRRSREENLKRVAERKNT